MIRQGIQTRLLATLGILFALGAGNSIYSWIAADGVRANLAVDIGNSVAMMDQADQMAAGIANMRSAMRGISLFSFRQNPAQVAKNRNIFDETASQLRKTIQTMEGNANTADEEAIRAMDA